MFKQRIKSLAISNFGPFVGEHFQSFPQNGLLLIKGKVQESGDGSGAGKSFLLNAIPYILGGCPFSANELQSWYTEELPEAKIVLETSEGDVTLSRKKGLVLKAPFLADAAGESYKGKVAEAELDTLFGMDAKTRAQVTYRPQRKPGLFLSMSDPEKKAFLTKLLELDKYERVSKQAQDALSHLESDLLAADSAYLTSLGTWTQAKARFDEIVLVNNPDEYLKHKSELEVTIAALKLEQKQLLKNIEDLRLGNNQELEAVLSTVRSKIAQANLRGEPVEITACKKEVVVLQQELEALKQQDWETKAAVQKQRDLVAQEIKNIKTESDKVTAEKSSKANIKLAEIIGNMSLLKDSKSKLERLEAEHKKLLENVCPTCGQQWLEAQRAIKDLLDKKAVEQDNIQKLAKLQADRSALQERLKAFLEKQAAELQASTSKKKEELAFLKEPEANPRLEEKKLALAEMANKIKALEDKTRLQKQQDLEELFREEKIIKQEFIDNLGIQVGAQKGTYDGLELRAQQGDRELRDILAKIAEVKQQELLKRDREGTLANAAESLQLALAKKEALQAKLALESDVVALVGYRGFLGAIFSDILAEISYQTNDILSKVANVRHLTIDFETEKEAVTSGNVVARITPVIYNRGRKVSFAAGISGGMQTAVELGVDLAVGNVVSSRRNTYPNFLILDESLHGLGGVAKESCIEMLQSVAGDRLVLVVDHSTEFCNLFNQVIEVEQTDGVSRIC